MRKDDDVRLRHMRDDKLARSVELATGKPVGWLDSPPEGISSAESERLVDILKMLGDASKLDDVQRNAFITFLAALTQES